MLLRLPLLLLALCCTLLHAEDEVDSKDQVLRRDGRPMRTLVQMETPDFFTHKVVESQASAVEVRWREVFGIVYDGMQRGFWQRATEALQAGDVNTAADNYLKVYQSAGREWEKAYGLYALGDVLERQSKFDEAYAVFARLIEELPEHRLLLNARYRAGICAVLAGKTAEAKTQMDALKEASRGRAGRNAEYRLKAIEAVTAVKAGRFADARRDARIGFPMEADDQLTFGDKHIWLHWSSFWGNTLQQEKQWDDAAKHYEGMLRELAGDSAAKAAISLTIARILVQAQRTDEALYRALYLDALPVGSIPERAEARLIAGRILLDQAKAQKDAAESKRLQGTARELLQAVIDAGEAASQFAEEAKKILPSA